MEVVCSVSYADGPLILDADADPALEDLRRLFSGLRSQIGRRSDQFRVHAHQHAATHVAIVAHACPEENWGYAAASTAQEPARASPVAAPTRRNRTHRADPCTLAKLVASFAWSGLK